MIPHDFHSKNLDKLAVKSMSLPMTHRVRMLAGIFYKGEFISIEPNSEKSHPFHKRFVGYRDSQIYPHAEVNAIRKSLDIITPKELEKSILYVCRVRRGDPNGEFDNRGFGWGNSKPCKGCMGAISCFNIPEVYYSLDKTFDYAQV